jgi:tetratricopeptide (TPR) repeat protein
MLMRSCRSALLVLTITLSAIGCHGRTPEPVDVASNTDPISPALKQAEDAVTNRTLNQIKVAFREGRQDEVLRIWRARCSNPLPAEKEVHSVFAKCLSNAGMLVDALAEADAAIRLDPKSEPLILGRAWDRFNLRHYQDALDDFAETMRLSGKTEDAQFGHAVSLAALGKFQAAAKEISEWLQAYPLAASQRISWARQARGLCLLRMNEFRIALEDLEKSTQLNDGIAFRYAFAFGLYESGESSRALDQLDELMHMHPNYANMLEFHRARAVCLRKLGRLAESAEALRRSKRTENSRAKFVSEFDEMIRRDPRNVYAYEQRAELSASWGDRDRAIADCSRALEIDPQCWIALSVRADVFAERDPDRAIVDCDLGLKLNPGFVEFRRIRAVAQARKGNFTLALEDADEAIRMRPGIGRLHRLRATVLQSLRKHAQAATDLARAEELGDEEFESPEDFHRKAEACKLSVRAPIELPPVEIDSAPLTLPPAPLAAAGGAGAVLPVGKSDGRSNDAQILAPQTDPTPPPPPLVVAIPTQIPTVLPLPPGASLPAVVTPSHTDPNRLPPLLILQTTGQESPLPPSPKR